MKNVIYDAETGEITIEEVPDVEMPVVDETPDAKATALAAIEKATTIATLRNAMLNYIEVSGVN